METKFTKGKWFIKESFIENTNVLCQTVLITDLKYNDMRSPVICDLWGQATEEGRQTAKLLCAAPDLLNSLNDILIYFKNPMAHDLEPLIRNAEKAIQKAVGSVSF